MPFYSKILQAIENECSRKHNLLLFRTLRVSPDTPPEDLKLSEFLEIEVAGKKAPRARGVILTGSSYPNVLQALRRVDIPFILLGNNCDRPPLCGDAVVLDWRQGAYDATRYLMDLGHKQILFIGNPGMNRFSSLDEGYRQAISEGNGHPITQTKSISDNYYSNGYLSIEMMFEKSPQFTAILAGYDETALGAWKALTDRNLSVPRDVSLIGFVDENYAAYTVPPLTTVRIDAEGIGRKLITQLYKKLEDCSVTLPVIELKTALIKRGTCLPPRPTPAIHPRIIKGT